MPKADPTKLGWFDRTIDNCIVTSIPAGDAPKFIKVKLPGPDEPVIDAWWNGIPDLEEDQVVSVRRSDGLQAQYTISGGGSGTAPPSPHTHPASAIIPDTTNFDGNLSPADNTVQKALETLDEMSSGSWPFFNVVHATSDAELTAAVAAATAGQTTIIIDCDIQLTDDIEINKAISIVGFSGGYSVPTIKGPVGGGRCFTISGTNADFVSFSNLTMETVETDILFATNSSLFLENVTARFVGPVTGDVGGVVSLVNSSRSEDIQVKVFNCRFLNINPGDGYGFGLWLVNTDTGYGPDALTAEVHHSAFAVVSSDIEAEEATIKLYDPVLPNGVNETGCVVTGAWMDGDGNRLPVPTVSQLAAADGSPDPAWGVDNAGNLSNPGSGVLDVNGVADAIVLDADADTSISAPTDDQIDVEAGGADIFKVTSAGLTMLSGLITHAKGVAAYHSTTQTLNNANAANVMSLDSERQDDAAFHDNSTNNTRLTVPSGYDGWYIIQGTGGFSADSTGTYRQIAIRMDGTTTIAQNQQPAPGSAQILRINITAVYYLTAGQYVELVMSHNATTNLTSVQGANSTTEFRMVRVG